jgi:hypothetical protein
MQGTLSGQPSTLKFDRQHTRRRVIKEERKQEKEERRNRGERRQESGSVGKEERQS